MIARPQGQPTARTLDLGQGCWGDLPKSNVRLWHGTDITAMPNDVRFRG